MQITKFNPEKNTSTDSDYSQDLSDVFALEYEELKKQVESETK